MDAASARPAPTSLAGRVAHGLETGRWSTTALVALTLLGAAALLWGPAYFTLRATLWALCVACLLGPVDAPAPLTPTRPLRRALARGAFAAAFVLFVGLMAWKVVPLLRRPVWGELDRMELLAFAALAALGAAPLSLLEPAARPARDEPPSPLARGALAVLVAVAWAAWAGVQVRHLTSLERGLARALGRAQEQAAVLAEHGGDHACVLLAVAAPWAVAVAARTARLPRGRTIAAVALGAAAGSGLFAGLCGPSELRRLAVVASGVSAALALLVPVADGVSAAPARP